MSRDSGIEDDFYEESMMSHHAYVSTSMDNMMEHYTDNGSTCLGDMACYNNKDSPSMGNFKNDNAKLLTSHRPRRSLQLECAKVHHQMDKFQNDLHNFKKDMDNDFDKNMRMVAKTNDALRSLEKLTRKSAKVKGHRRERHMDDQVSDLHQPSARHANDLRRHHHKAPSTSCATTTMAPRASLPPRHQASTPKLDFHDLANEENVNLYFAKLDSMSLPPPLLRDVHKKVEHGIFPSTMEESDDAHLMTSNLEGDKVKNGEHGIFSSPKEAHGVEETDPIPICLSDDVVPIPCEYESHLAHLSEHKSEMSDSTVYEIECFHFEGMSNTPSELRVVVDRSSEAISISNDLPSTSSVFSCVVLGFMEEDAPSHGAMMPQLEKMY